MIRSVSHCPYCGHLSAGIDDKQLEFVLAPDHGDGQPYPHLAFVWVGLHALTRSCRIVSEGSRVWFWIRGEGTKLVPDMRKAPLAEYVSGICCDDEVEESHPQGEYRIGGASAGGREEERPGSGEFHLHLPSSQRVVAILDGYGIYGPDPDALVAEVRRFVAVITGAVGD